MVDHIKLRALSYCSCTDPQNFSNWNKTNTIPPSISAKEEHYSLICMNTNSKKKVAMFVPKQQLGIQRENVTSQRSRKKWRRS